MSISCKYRILRKIARAPGVLVVEQENVVKTNQKYAHCSTQQLQGTDLYVSYRLYVKIY